jgi:nucleoside-diphosphate-sugar epimerase
MINPLQSDLDHILSHTNGLWDELRGNRLFITGGTGFFGCWLLESFLWANDKLGLQAEAVVLTRSPEAFMKKAPHLARHPAIRCHGGDVRDFQFPEGEFSHVIHAATEANAKLNVENPLLMFDTIVEGTRRVLDFTVKTGAKKFLLTSSGAVYGKQPSEMTHIPECYQGAPDPLLPNSAYGEGKRAAELLCALYAKHHGLEPKIARCFAFVGPYLPLDQHFAIGNFIRDALKGGPIIVNGDGTPYRSYLYAADLVIWLLRILFLGKDCKPYNVGSSEGKTIEAIARLVAETGGGGAGKVLGEAQTRKQPERYVPDVSCAEIDLGLRVWTDLRAAIRNSMYATRQSTQ